VLDQLRAHLDREGFEDVEIVPLGGTYPARTEPAHPFVQMAIDTARRVYGREPAVSPMTGGSGPIHPFIHDLGLPVVTSGVGYPGSRIHAPNENIRLQDFALGIRHVAHLVAAFSRRGR
jgi:acetylornithine deacetylase/succinyl-diaminopimelate desuccinylase-like protein